MKNSLLLFSVLVLSLWGCKKSASDGQIMYAIFEDRTNEVDPNDPDKRIIDSMLALPAYARFDVSEIIQTKLDHNGLDGYFIVYTQAIKNTASTSDMSSYTGVAFFEKVDGKYKLKFENAHAMFCADCNNVTSQSLWLKKDTVDISISWGPSINRQFTGFTFAFDKSANNWRLAFIDKDSQANEEGSDGRFKIDPDVKMYISSYDAEMTGFNEDLYAALYTADDLYVLNDTFARYVKDKANDFEDCEEVYSVVFRDKDAKSVAKGLTDENVDYAIRVTEYLDQLEGYSQAEILLKAAIKKFPDRADDAYRILGDVYRKQSKFTEAKSMYQKFSQKATENGLQDKIPDYITSYIENN